jgi:hypothetical protein
MPHLSDDTKRAYIAPSIKVMDEDEVLKTFQLTSAMTGWWIVTSG